MSRSDRASRISERVYGRLLIAYPKDFSEEYGPQMEQAFRDLCREEMNRAGVYGLSRAWVRASLDLVSTAPVERIGRTAGNDEEMSVNDYRLAGLGFVLLVAPLYFVSASILKYEMGIGLLFDPLEALLSEPGRRQVFNLVSPVVFLGGLILALVMNARAVLRLNIGREDGAIVSTVRLQARFWNIAVTAVSLLLLVTLLGYFFAENFVYRP
jgi:hypothetical protein